MLRLLIFIACAAYCVGQNDKLPSGFKVCQRKDASFNDCLARAIEGAIILLKNGNELFKIPSIDPYRVDHMEAEHSGGNANFNLKSTIKNGDLTGLSKPEIQKIATKFDKKFGLKAEVKSKHLQLIGDYTMNGQILVLPIKGIGKANMTLNDITTLVDMRGDYFEKSGKTYLNITRMSLRLTPRRAYYAFENIFNGDPTLSATISNFMNENSELVSKTLLPGYEEKLSLKFKAIANSIFGSVPMNLIFPE